MSIKNPIKTNNLSDFGEIAERATSVSGVSQSSGQSLTSSPAKEQVKTKTFEDEVEDEINKRVKKENLK